MLYCTFYQIWVIFHTNLIHNVPNLSINVNISLAKKYIFVYSKQKPTYMTATKINFSYIQSILSNSFLKILLMRVL